MDLLPRLIAFVQAHPELSAARPFVVGVSGGADSLALLHLLNRLLSVPPFDVAPLGRVYSSPERSRRTEPFGFAQGKLSRSAQDGQDRPSPLWVAHLDHALRPESGADADFVARIAAQWKLPAVVERKDVRAFAEEHKLSLEEAGRRARYAFLARVAAQHGAGAIFVGHNADDQSETVLMHLLRGSGLAGLRGMLPVSALADLRLPGAPPRAGLLLARPLLTTTRAEIEAYCAAHGLQPRYDASNEDLTFFRNRLRHEALPLLESLNPKARLALRRMADIVAADYEVLRRARDAAWESVVIHPPDGQPEVDCIAFDRGAFGALLPGLRRALLRQAIARLRPGLRDVDYTPVAHAADFVLSAKVGQRVPLPGDLSLAVEYEQLVIAPNDAAPLPAHLPHLPQGAHVPLPTPGRLVLESCGWRVEVDEPDTLTLEAILANRDSWVAYLDADRLSGPLALRPRRPGDRFQPLGLEGHTQTIADFMINAKIPSAWRDRLPLLVSGEQIVWLPGWQIGHRVRVTETTRHIWRVRMCPASL